MALTLKSLAAGVLKSGSVPFTAVILPGSATKNTLVTSIYLVNLHTSPATLDWLYIRRYISTQGGYQDFPFYKGQSIAAGAVLPIVGEITLGSNVNNGNPAVSAPDQIVAK